MNESWRTESGDTVEVFAGEADETWFWHLRSPNGQIIATSGESFTRYWSAVRAARRSFPSVEHLA